MKAALVAVIVWIACVTFSPVVVASGSGHGGGHSGGGHPGGGHAASGGHASAGHSGGSTHGVTTSAGRATPRSTGTSQPATTTTAARPRTGQPVTGRAVPRTTPKVPPTASIYPLYGGWPYYGALGFGGLGFYTDPFLFGSASSDFAYLPGYSGDAVLPPYPLDATGPTGGIRLKVEPKQAQVYVDGYYAGIVDDFNGIFHHLDVTPGPHHVEIRAPRYDPLMFDVTIQARHTIEYRGALMPSNP